MTVMVVDDHPRMRVGIAAIVNARPDMTVVAQAETGEQSVHLYQRHHPDVTLMDLKLPGKMGGAEAIAAIRSTDPNARFIVVTTYEGDVHLHRTLDAAAQRSLITATPSPTSAPDPP